MNVGQLIARARGSSTLTVRGLASRAGVAGSTITRVQANAVDPTVHTLERLLNAAGYELRLDVYPKGTERRPTLADLVGAWSLRGGKLRLEWSRWRALLDDLALRTERIPEAIYTAPPPSGSPTIDALLAAVAEKLADDANLPRPRWTEQVPGLDAPYQPPVPREVRDRTVPAQLAARGLLIDTESLWRRPETIGV